MEKIDAVIFDMDGVLIDSEPIYMHHVLSFYERFGIHVPYEEVVKLASSSNEASWQMMASWWKEAIDPKELEQLYETIMQGEEEVVFADIVNPYVRYILPRLRERGIKTAIASSSPMSAIHAMMQQCQLSNSFDLVVTGRDFPFSKPDPAIYLHTVKQLKVAKEHCIIIEDSTYGIEAAIRADIKVAALKDERFHYDQTKATYLVHDLLEAYHLILEGED
ncbi:HAD family hydrolase [Longicatena caecimuris]|uniref:HAD family hydrolase n=1 Tax=Longicatena caecimuris TaxID=1796635 RepID=UPI003AB39887